VSAESQDRIARAADLLVQARRTGQLIEGLGDAAPQTEDEAWAVQREVARRLDLAVGGWKCAAPPGRPQSGAMMPVSGFLKSPAQQKVVWGQQIGIEAEIAVRIGVDLPGKPGGYGRDDILAAIATVMPAIELVQSRYTDMRGVSNFEGMADSIAHFGFVYGEEVTDWRGLDLSQLRVQLTFDDEVQVEQVGGNPSGDPILPVIWLANRLIETGTHLRAGEIVTTGSCTGLIFTLPGKVVKATFEGLGAVVLELPAACPFGFG
jgi:2-keto-4-pentenoate hydratase